MKGISSKEWWKGLIKNLIMKQNITDKMDVIDAYGDYVYEEFKKPEYWQKYHNCEALLNNLKLLSYFKFILIPRTCEGVAKPDEKIFLKAFQMSKLNNRHEFLHVGDSYELDFKPALKLKFKSVMILHKDWKSNHTLNDKSINLEEMYKRNLLAGDLDDLFKKIVSL